MARISGPLLDRIDLHVDVEEVAWLELDAPRPEVSTDALRERVRIARESQLRRGGTTNARLTDARLDAEVNASPEARALLGRAFERFGLSARGARRVLRVARTIADLAGETATGTDAVAEALSFRGECR